MSVYFDISKLAGEPRRSGIQRAERAILRHWAGPRPLVPCRYDPASARLRTLPDSIRDVLCADAPAGGEPEERAALAPYLADLGPPVPRGAPLLCAELFDDPNRAAYHRAEAAHAYWLAFDFLPWLHPDWFPAGPANRLMPFLHAMRQIHALAFISPATRRDAERLFGRAQRGPVLPLGTDGLGLEPQAFNPARRDVVLLGTIEARKNVAAAIAAFRALWSEVADARLVLIGAVEPDALAERALLRELAGERRLVVTGPLPDEAVRAALRRARTLLFPSEGEGYGLPPMEALAAGLPVIVAERLPALHGLEPAGQIRLARTDPASIKRALHRVFDDGEAARLFAAAAALALPSWADFAAAVARWVSGAPAPVPA